MPAAVATEGDEMKIAASATAPEMIAHGRAEGENEGERNVKPAPLKAEGSGTHRSNWIVVPSQLTEDIASL